MWDGIDREFLWDRVERGFDSLNLGVDVSHSDGALEPRFLEIYRACKGYSQTSRARMYALYKSIEYIVKARVPGDIVECGVWTGGSMMLAARTLLALGERDRRIFLFDTFEGMSRPGEHDRLLKGGTPALPKWERVHRGYPAGSLRGYAGSIGRVRRNLESTGYPTDRLVFVQGRVEDTLPASSPDSVALLRLDTDWYESTKHELRCLYPRLARRGVLIVDDYGCWAGAKRAVDEYFADRPFELMTRIDHTGRLALKTEPEAPGAD